MSKKARAEARRLDTAQAARGLWLVKVPNYLSEAWEKAGQDDCVGVLKVTRYVHAAIPHLLTSCCVPPARRLVRLR